MTESLTLTAIEAADVLGVHRQTFVRWAEAAGLVPAGGNGQRRRWSRADVEVMARREEQPSRRCAVYRCFDEERSLLYVGSTGNLGARRAEHSVYSAWSELVAFDEGVWRASLQQAKREERDAIIAERPLFNRQFADAETDARAREYLERIGREDLIEPCLLAGRLAVQRH